MAEVKLYIPFATLEQAKLISNKLNIGVCHELNLKDSEFVLEICHDNSCLLHWTTQKQYQPISIRFQQSFPITKRTSPLLRAIGTNKKTVLDLTAGWGQDAFLMSSYGHIVYAFERNKIIAFMVQNALEQLPAEKKFHLYQSDSKQYLLSILGGSNPKADVIYFDPMFPSLNKFRNNKKNISALQRLEPPNEKSDHEILELALKCATQRVVTKRYPKAKPMLGEAVTGTVASKLVHFDIYAAR